MSKKTKQLVRLLKNLLIHPAQLAIVFRDILGSLHQVHSDKLHLEAAIDWLGRSQDVSAEGGCAGVYTFLNGWTGPYPETTGYIISTFLVYYELTNEHEYLERAKKLGDWEIGIQLPSGAVRGGVGINEYPIVFNTGQVILGWIALHKSTQLKKYLESVTKAAEWLVKIQDQDGKWSISTYQGIPHAYNTRVAWALLEVSKLTGKKEFRYAAESNINWVLAQTNENAWINHMGFNTGEQPLTHTVAYTLRGLLECSYFVSEELKSAILHQVTSASEHILKVYNFLSEGRSSSRGFLPGTFNHQWNSNDSYSCLTGNAQMAIIWMRLYQVNGEEKYLDAALRIINQIKSTQKLKSRNSGIRGGIAGSYPIWGKYVNFGYPNWAAKFFADALMLKMKIEEQ